MSKINFWDHHNGLAPLSDVIANRFIATLYDSDGDLGVFTAGVGEDTLNGVKYAKRTIVHDYEGYVTKKAVRLRRPDKLIWVIHTEEGNGLDGKAYLYAPDALETNGCETYYYRGTRMYDVTGWSYTRILTNCQKEDFDKTYYRNHYEDKVALPKFLPVDWYMSCEYNGHHILEILATKPNRTVASIKKQIANEGALWIVKDLSIDL